MENSTNQSGSLNINLTWRVQDWTRRSGAERQALKVEMSLSFLDFPEKAKRSVTQIISKSQFRTHSQESYIETTFRYMLSQLLKNLTTSPDLKFW